MTINGIKIITQDSISLEELTAYVNRAKDLYGNRLIQMRLSLDGEHVKINYGLHSTPFERIRRITGYLTPLNRYNNAKAAEEHDRVKHEVGL